MAPKNNGFRVFSSLRMTIERPHIIETPEKHGLLFFSPHVLKRTGSRRRRYRGARADQHRQDPSRDRADAGAFLRRDRPAAASPGARSLQQDSRSRLGGFGGADYRPGE